MKEAGIINVVWMSGVDMTSDMFTKNLPTASFERHKRLYVLEDDNGANNRGKNYKN